MKIDNPEINSATAKTQLTADDSTKVATTKFVNAVLDSHTITLTGDVIGSGVDTIPTTLATVNSNTGSFGSSTAIPSFTVNAKGLMTAASTNVVIAPAGTLTGTTLKSTVVSSSLTGIGTLASGAVPFSLVTGTVPVGQGGTEQTTFINGQLLIGNTTGNTLVKATLTGTSNQIAIANGAGSITLSTPQDIATTSSPTFAALTLNSAGDTALNFTESAAARWTISYSVTGNYLFFRDTQNSRDLLRLLDTGNITMPRDSQLLLFGTGSDASITYDGSHFVFNSREVGGGAVKIAGETASTTQSTMFLNEDIAVVSSSGIPKLTIGNTNANSALFLGQDATHNLGLTWVFNATAGSAYAAVDTLGGNNALVLQPSGGKVGIGTVTPIYNLHIRPTSSHATLFLDGASGQEGVIRFGDAGTAIWAITSSLSGDQNFRIYRNNNGFIVSLLINRTTGSVFLPNDSQLLLFGAAGDAAIDYDGSNFVFNSQVVGVGDFVFAGGSLLNRNDNSGFYTGAGDDFRIYYDGTNAIYNSANVGSGFHQFNGRGLVIGAATGADKGLGTINVAGDIYKNNTAYTNPDYALEHYFTGEIVRFKDNDGAADYRGITPLSELREHMETNMRLPGITDETAGAFKRSDIVLEKLEEAYLYIIELSERITKLENKHGT